MNSMAENIDELICRLPGIKTEWGDALAPEMIALRGARDLKSARSFMAYPVIVKDTVLDYPHVHHSVEEYFMFAGADMANFFDFDAKIELWLGDSPETLEPYEITAPSLVRIPPNVWHGPIRFSGVKKPVSLAALYFDGELAKITRVRRADGTVDYPYFSTGQRVCRKTGALCTMCGACNRAAKEQAPGADAALVSAVQWAEELAAAPEKKCSGKYADLIFTYPMEYHQYGDTYANPRGKFRGITQMPGVKFYGGFSVVLKDTEMEIPHIHHANDEYLWFIGANLADPYDFDAEVEVDLGWDLDHMQTYRITEPTVIRVPPNLWHCPLRFRRVTRPVAFMPIYSDGDWSKIVANTAADGTRSFSFEAASLRRCVYHHEKICNYCGGCLNDKSVPDFGIYL